MKVYIESKNEIGKIALLEMLNVKSRANFAQRLGLKFIEFDAVIINKDPLKIMMSHKSWNTIPYTIYHAEVFKNSVLGIFKSCDVVCSYNDIEVTCEK
jgi:hypothetical protein